jgi:hypothetical protein
MLPASAGRGRRAGSQRQQPVALVTQVLAHPPSRGAPPPWPEWRSRSP